MRKSYKTESKLEYLPMEKTILDSVAVEKVEYIPVEKKITDFITIEHKTEYVPVSKFETKTNYQPVDRVEYEEVRTTEYVPVETIEYVPRTITDYVAVEEVEEKVDYQPVVNTIVRYPGQEAVQVVGGGVTTGP